MAAYLVTVSLFTQNCRAFSYLNPDSIAIARVLWG